MGSMLETAFSYNENGVSLALALTGDGDRISGDSTCQLHLSTCLEGDGESRIESQSFLWTDSRSSASLCCTSVNFYGLLASYESILTNADSSLICENWSWIKVGRFSGAGGLTSGSSEIIEILTGSSCFELEESSGKMNCAGARCDSCLIFSAVLYTWFSVWL